VWFALVLLSIDLIRQKPRNKDVIPA
jgi:hypothetical protein